MHVTVVEIAVPIPLRQTFTYSVPTSLKPETIFVGERVVVPFSNRQLVGIICSVNTISEPLDTKIKPIIKRFNSPFHFSKSEIEFLQWLANYYHYPIGEVCHTALPALLRKTADCEIKPTFLVTLANDSDVHIRAIKKNAKAQLALIALLKNEGPCSEQFLIEHNIKRTTINALIDKNIIAKQQILDAAFNWQEQDINQFNKLKLTTEQALTISNIHAKIGSFSCHLIEGITGSGKTEVYFQVMESILSCNQQVLLLVPEIGLTPQLISRVQQRFNVPIACHHSGMNDTGRLETWYKAKTGQAAIIIGTRSAVFTPLKHVGLIIVDEEHDSSFKQNDTFRYHARDIAIIRAKREHIPVMLGSATPSLESLNNALEAKYFHHRLTERPQRSTPAKISLIDMNKQPVRSGLSLTLMETMQQVLQRNEQVMIFLNRRGYSPAICCDECHQVIECQHCNRPLTYHKQQRSLICHHCGFQQVMPKQCGDCGSVRLIPIGQGTEQIEQLLAENFPDKNIIRIDRDSTSKKGELAKVLQQVTDEQYQIIVGTQMLAKGHHFPKVTLVAMINIDGALFSYDFRAPEHLAQLIEQVAGRSGRETTKGNVLIQTYFPDHPLLQDLANNGYSHFARAELIERKQASLPPYVYQFLIRAEAQYADIAQKFLYEIAKIPLERCQVAGPIPAAMEKKANKYCFHLFVQSGQRNSLHRAANQVIALIERSQLTRRVRWSIDIDPVDISW